MLYHDYLASLQELELSINQSEELLLKVEDPENSVTEESKRNSSTSITVIQQQARALESDYQMVARRLKAVGAFGIRLPERVRPGQTDKLLVRAVERQQAAVRTLYSMIETYEAQTRSSQRAAAAALAERQGRLSQNPKNSAGKEAVAERAESQRKSEANYKREATSQRESEHTPNTSASESKSKWFTKLGKRLGKLLNLDSDADRHPVATKLDQSGASKPLKAATEPGIISGYEPNVLEEMQLPTFELMYGTPGAGLSESGFNETAIRLGQIGERNFAKALAKEGLLERFATFWSVHMLSKDTYGKQDADVDCAIITGQTIWLVDVKYYTGGNVVYRANDDKQIVCFDIPTGQQVGKPKFMTKNMKMGIDRFKSRYQNYKNFRLEARVVFVPTNAGVGKIEGVYWPGKIPAVTLPEFIAELEGEPAFIASSLEGDLVRRTFAGLVKMST